MELPASFVELALSAYLLLNLVAFALFGVDKSRAVRGGWRIRESSLLLWGAIGPFGAYLGMLSFRHKTRRGKFLLVPAFMVIHVIVAGSLLFLG